MAAITPTSTKYNVIGNQRQQFYTLAGSSGDTLTLGLTTIRKINTSAGTLFTAIATAVGSNPGTTTITFTASGPFTGEVIEVIGN